MNEVDLHCHTTASDGALTPSQLVNRAARLAVRIIAITDHDSTDGVPEALVSGREHGVEVIPGVEINTDVPGGEVHVLGYFVDHASCELATGLAGLCAGRLARAQRIVDTLSRLGAPVSLQRVLEISGGGAVGRPHVAQALLEAGHVTTFNEAFDRYIGRNGPAYVPRQGFSPAQACQLVRRAGGVPVMAHPVAFGPGGVIKAPADLGSLLPELIDAGLMGLEVYYPGYDAITIEYLLAVARKHGLLVTGGTDFHGTQPERPDIGGIHVPMKAVRRLRRAREGLAHAV